MLDDSADHFTGNGTARFERYRNARVVMRGSGQILTAWERAVRESGLHRVSRVLDDQADLVVHLSDWPSPELALQLSRWCDWRGVPLIQAVRHGEDVWIDDAGWESLTLRLGTSAHDSGATELSSLAAAVIGRQVALRCLRLLTGGEGFPLTTQVEVASLRHHAREVLPHPFALPATVETEEEFLSHVAELETGPRLSEKELAKLFVRCCDDQVGVFREMTELPPHVARIVVAVRTEPVYAAGPDLSTAGHAATLRAFETYLKSIVDTRRFAAGDRLWGLDLVRRQALLAKAPRGMTGGITGAGLDWAEAVHAALVNACRSLTLAWLDDATWPFPRIELAEPGPPNVSAYDVTGPLGVPTFAFCLGEQTVAYACAADPLDAVRGGLTEVAWAHQAPETREPVRQLPARLRGRAVAPPATEVADPLAALVAAGHRPVVRPLDHDPAVHDLFPYAVEIVLHDD